MDQTSYKITRECVSCGVLYRTTEISKEEFEQILEDYEDAVVSVEGDTDYIRFRGTCRGCREDYESSQD